MSVSTNDLKNGMALNLPEGLVTVVEFQHVKPGKGGAFVRTRLKNVRSGAVLDKTFRADEKVPLAVIDKRETQYLYRDGDNYVFMDSDSYEQETVEAATLGGAVGYLREGDTVVLPTYDGA
ncbi:MAG: elongation factor P, partial [Candidatus Rokuibacteriota bacterium]